MATLYLVKVFRALAELIEVAKEILEDVKPQVHDILKDATDSTSSVREVIVRVNKVLTHFVSLPELAKTFTRQALSSLLNKEKR